jgi:2-methylcitrate dehydratase PrpD
VTLTGVRGSSARAGEILKEYARQEHGGSDASLLFGAGEASKTGAAFAFAQQCECVDAHDGLNRSNAHISATLLPAMFAHATPRTDGAAFVEAFAIGLEAFVRRAYTQTRSQHRTTVGPLVNCSANERASRLVSC